MPGYLSADRYLFPEANSFPRAKLEQNCELRGTDNIQGQISVHYIEAKWWLLCLLSFTSFFQGLSVKSFLVRSVQNNSFYSI